MRNAFGPLSFVEIYPYTVETIKIAAQTEATARSLERLGFRACTGVVIVGPFFSGGRMRTQAEDHQLTSEHHLGNDLLVSAALEIGAGMDRVFAGPASRGKQRVQAIRVGPLISVGDHLTAQFAVLGGIRDSPIDPPGIKGNLQGRTEVLDLLL
jgi:hypothetical protein